MSIGLAVSRQKPADIFPSDPAFLRSLLQCSANSIAVIGPDGRSRFISPRGLERFGQSDVAAWIGKPWLDLWPEACAEVLGVMLARALSGAKAACDVRCDQGEGHASWWEVCFSPWPGPDEAMSVVAVARDVTERHVAVEHADLLVQELHHRVRNMLSMVQAILRLSASCSNDTNAFIDSVEQRIDALARTHALLTDGNQGETDLRELLEAELSPFARDGRIRLVGPFAPVREPSASALSLALHELTTNCVKYGALSGGEGQLEVAWTRGTDEPMRIRWTERGIVAPAAQSRAGFGSLLLGDLLSDQLHVEREWNQHGLIATIAVQPKSAPSRAAN